MSKNHILVSVTFVGCVVASPSSFAFEKKRVLSLIFIDFDAHVSARRSSAFIATPSNFCRVLAMSFGHLSTLVSVS